MPEVNVLMDTFKSSNDHALKVYQNKVYYSEIMDLSDTARCHFCGRLKSSLNIVSMPLQGGALNWCLHDQSCVSEASKWVQEGNVTVPKFK